MSRRPTIIKLGPHDAAIVIREDEGPEIFSPNDPIGGHAALAVAAIVEHSLPTTQALGELMAAFAQNAAVQAILELAGVNTKPPEGSEDPN